MKVALIGASGQGGSRLLAELTRRGHQVTAIARNPEKITAGPAVTAKKGDVFDKAGLVQLLRGHDAVVSAVHFTASDPKLLIEAVKEAGVRRAQARSEARRRTKARSTPSRQGRGRQRAMNCPREPARHLSRR
jgi:putative NADH-flavin reductase